MKKVQILTMVVALSVMWLAAAADPYVDRVVSVSFGEGADAAFSDTEKVLGAPESFDAIGLGGSTDVLNIGLGGTVVVDKTGISGN